LLEKVLGTKETPYTEDILPTALLYHKHWKVERKVIGMSLISFM
jgi:hypothetical protein